VEVRRVLLLVAAVIALSLPIAEAGAGTVTLGVIGSPSRMHDQTGQSSGAVLHFTGWNGGLTWGGHFAGLFDEGKRIPVFSFGTHVKSNTHEAITPRAIANGYGDHYLIAMNQAIFDYGRPIYIRPMAEMNGWWNFYSAFNQNGSSRGRSHSTKSFRLAFKRIYVILHGGEVASLNTRFANWGVRKLQSDKLALPENPYPTLKVFWNPQGFGSPDIPANSAQSYYPGDGYVDVVGDDIYDLGGKYEYSAMVDLYKAHPTKPFAIGEFGLWNVDDPGFIQDIANFIKNRPRTELAVFNRAESGSIFDLGSKSKSRGAYRHYLTPLG
jgi:Glycosyl hydrolase family 26